MCRNSAYCKELGNDPEAWDLNCPLPIPIHFDNYLNFFVTAVDTAIKGDFELALGTLQKTNSDELRNWFVEHGQMSGWHHRVKILKVAKPNKFQGILETNRRINNFESDVYSRDRYICQYCGIRVIDPKVLRKIEKLFGKENFKSSGRNNDVRHGISLTFRATADHVLPISHGGRTNLDNLVTCCWNCNYGKYNVLIEQMGILDPRLKPKQTKESWQGLTDRF